MRTNEGYVREIEKMDGIDAIPSGGSSDAGGSSSAPPPVSTPDTSGASSAAAVGSNPGSGGGAPAAPATDTTDKVDVSQEAKDEAANPNDGTTNKANAIKAAYNTDGDQKQANAQEQKEKEKEQPKAQQAVKSAVDNIKANQGQGLLAPRNMSQQQKYQYYKNLLEANGGRMTPNGATVLAIRGQSADGQVHPTTSSKKYDDTMVILGQNGTVKEMAADTHPAQNYYSKAPGGAPGMLNAGNYVATPRQGDFHGMPAWRVLNQNGTDGVPGTRDLNHDGVITDAEKARVNQMGGDWNHLSGVLIHRGGSTPWSAGCQNPINQQAFIDAVGGPNARFNYSVLDANSARTMVPGAGYAPPAAAPTVPAPADNNPPVVNAPGGGAPNYGGGAPNYGGGAPNYGGGAPNYGGDAPNYGGGVPNYGGGVPNYGGGVPNYGGGVPNYGGGVPNYGGGVPYGGGGGVPYGGGGDMPYGGGGVPYGGGGAPYGGGGGFNPMQFLDQMLQSMLGNIANGGGPFGGSGGQGMDQQAMMSMIMMMLLMMMMEQMQQQMMGQQQQCLV